MTIFDVAFWPMERVHADLHGKPLMKIELTSLRLRVPGENATSEQAVPFDLVYALSPEETKAITEGAAASAGQTPT
ncbi:MAG TPA: hypothetical protein VNX21_01410 [Candidatus Thermoplasmatota archaeon]|nr:hypothetical protein [Candidatus Thermoplasmatota archaeon]